MIDSCPSCCDALEGSSFNAKPLDMISICLVLHIWRIDDKHCV